MFTRRTATIGLCAALIVALSACGSDPEQEARELCHERVAAESIQPSSAEFVLTEASDPVESTYFYFGVVEFPVLGEMVPHVYRCKVNPEIEGIIFNETVVEKMTG